MPLLSKRHERQLMKDGYDLALLSTIQPQGNLTFRKSDRYFEAGDGLHTTLHYYGYPASDLPRFWLTDLLQLSDTIAFLSLYRQDNQAIKTVLQDSIEEKSTRLSNNAKVVANQTELSQIRELTQLHQEIERTNLATFGMYTRVYVSDQTRESLFEQVTDLKNKTSKYKATILLGEQDLEYQAPFVPASLQQNLPNHRKGTFIRVDDLAGGYPFNHTKLEDERGSYFGWTPTKGAVNFNFLHRDDRRTRSFMIVSGNPKMGQRSFLLKQTDDLYAKGHFIRNLDASGMFTDQTKQQAGLVLDLSGEANRINPFQIFPTVTKDNGIEVDEEKSYQQHLQKLKNLFQLLNSEVTGDDLATFGKLVNDFYIDEVRIWFRNPALHEGELRATQLVAEEYPILSDFILFLEDKKRQSQARKHPDKLELKTINRALNTFEELLSSHAAIFEGTTAFRDISTEQVVTFDLSGLVDSPHLLNAQVFSLLSLMSADIVNNGKQCRQRLKTHPHLTEMDMPHYIVTISDAQTLMTPQYEQSVSLLASVIDRMGYNFAGVILSVHSLEGILLESNQTSAKDPYVLAVRRIFGLMQYRVFAQTDETSIGLLSNALHGAMNASELETLPRLAKGQLLMNIAGVKNIVFNQQFLAQELERYGSIQ
ncbi:virulence factor [Streptococcus dysgalactiae]|uniref:Virulence factor n=1 Tax=Streptococcus dysgalactiae subsp. equisimilis TaxID=119602 RepID=A0AB38Y048_STREQ|nr:virulence factor [Streptococcus dysgalactiae]HEN6156962.1 virulence factor [Streptococcus agalactiae]HER1343155.1 virulence factor [Streptococcus pyogenes]MCY7206057.1 virulence factor [Streptococcus dysgalactiae]OBY98020.1 virulence factor [Streptococcus dysgalactiae subsp. equisimilis]OCX08424.1 virulence factor [Streptococcus dysgalactiae subsp. equisimilis AKSDE4288]